MLSTPGPTTIHPKFDRGETPRGGVLLGRRMRCEDLVAPTGLVGHVNEHAYAEATNGRRIGSSFLEGLTVNTSTEHIQPGGEGPTCFFPGSRQMRPVLEFTDRPALRRDCFNLSQRQLVLFGNRHAQCLIERRALQRSVLPGFGSRVWPRGS